MATRSLGQLTLDLVLKTGSYIAPLNKSGRELDKWKRKTKKNLKEAGAAFAGLAAGAAAAVTAIALKTLESAREIENLSKVANTLPEDFQKISYAAKRYGVEQEKVADILKDTSDKIGDFLQTGGGPMADFFEKIAPQVGVTAEQFRNLSGDQALGLYIKSLEKANLSQSEMTFYMEAVASDATLLLPLLKGNAAELNRLGSEAEQFGAVLSAIELQQLADVNEDVDKLRGAFNGLAQDVTLAALPAIHELTATLSDPKTIENARVLGEAIIVAMDAAAKVIGGVTGSVKNLAEWMAYFVGGPAFDDLPRLNKELDELIQRRDQLAAGGGGRSANANRDERIEALDKEIEKTKSLIALNEIVNLPVPESTQQTGGNLGLPGPQTNVLASPEDNAAVEKYLANLQQQVDMLGMSADAQELYKLKAEGATAAQLAQAEANMRVVAAYESIAESGKELDVVQETIDAQAEAIAESLMSQEEQLQESYERRREIILASSISTEEEKNELLTKLAEDHAKTIEGIHAGSVAMQLGNYSQLFDGIADITKGFGKKQSGLYKALFAASKGFAIAESIVKIQQGVANASALPFPTNIPAIAAVLSQTAGIISTIKGTQLQGVAHGGLENVPKEGTYLLDQGERVLSPRQNSDLVNFMENGGKVEAAEVQVNINVTNNNPNAQVTQSSRHAGDRKWVVDIMVEENANPSSRSRRALGSSSNVTSRGNR